LPDGGERSSTSADTATGTGPLRPEHPLGGLRQRRRTRDQAALAKEARPV